MKMLKALFIAAVLALGATSAHATKVHGGLDSGGGPPPPPPPPPVVAAF